MKTCPGCGRLHDDDETPITFGERVADVVAGVGSSWTFIGVMALAMGVWVAVNTLHGKPFDPYPFILMNLWISILTSFQGPIIMMSQDRLAARDRRRDEEDHQVNLSVAATVAELSAKVDRLAEKVSRGGDG